MMHAASIGRFSWNPIVKDDYCPTVVIESALKSVGFSKVANCVVVTYSCPV